MLSELTDIGFKGVGTWYLEDNKPKLSIHDESDTTDILYCFVVNKVPKYIGKTTQSLKKRMYGYFNPGVTQTTNIRNNENIKSALIIGSTVDLYVLPDHKLLHFGKFHLNLAAGLEDSIISILAPEWNLKGK